MYSARVAVDADLEFTQKALYTNVDAFEVLDYSHECFGSETGASRNSIKLISRSMLKKLSADSNEMTQGSRQLKYFQTRLRQLRKDAVIFNQSENSFTIYSGGYCAIK